MHAPGGVTECRRMTFGYLGYIWALFACTIIAMVVGASAVFLYAVARRARGASGQSSHSVESVPIRAREPADAGPPEDAS